MWLVLNSTFYLNYSSFFKVPYLVSANKNLNTYGLLYNTSIDKFFLVSQYDRSELIYLDKTETHNSYVTSYLINDGINYKSKLKPYYSQNLVDLEKIILNKDSTNTNFFRRINFGNCLTFQTEDEKYVVGIYIFPSNRRRFRYLYSVFPVKVLYVCDKTEFEDNLLLIGLDYLGRSGYITDNLHSKSEGFMHINYSIYSSFTNSIFNRIDDQSKKINVNSNHFYIKNNSKSDPLSIYAPQHVNNFPTWKRRNNYEYVFDTSENIIPDDIPQTLIIGYDIWELNIDFLGNNNYYAIASFEDDYSNKEKIVRYGFYSNTNISTANLYKVSTDFIRFVIEFSDELNSYKMFDINNPAAGYFLCYDNNCLKDHTSYKFKAFLNEAIYREDVFNYYKDNDLIITWKKLDYDFNGAYNNTIANNAYVYCLNKLNLLKIYNTQVPFIRF